MKKNGLILFLMTLALVMTMGFTGYLKSEAAKSAEQAIAVGIDVSKYQETIDWAQVAASGVKFAFVRVGTSRGMDELFAANMAGAAAAGIKTGVYIYSYALTPEEAAMEAAAVISAIDPFVVNMPVVIDVEDKIQKNLPAATLSAIVNQFAAVVQEAGYYPMVYSSKSWFDKQLVGVNCGKWVAQWSSACARDDAFFWQASCTGSVPGIKGDVDVDYQFVDLSSVIIPYGFVGRDGYYYFYHNYKMLRSQFVDYNGFRYYVDERGRKLVSCYPQLGDAIFGFDAEGRMITGWHNIGEERYYFAQDGRMATGLTQVGAQIFLFREDGRLYRGWYNDGVHVCYFDATDGHMAMGLTAIGGEGYYFDANGYQQLGWIAEGPYMYYFNPATNGTMVHAPAKAERIRFAIGDGIYCFDEQGHMSVGMLPVEGNIYYFNPENGRMLTGLLPLADGQYLFDPASGAMLTGMQNVGTGLAYFDPATGKQQVGFVPVKGSIYYFDPSTGVMLTGLQVIGTAKYYFDPASGVMLTGLQTIGGVNFYFDPATGAMLTGVQNVGGQFFFFDPVTGGMMTGVQTIGGVNFYFDPVTGAMATGTQVIGGNVYYFDPTTGGQVFGMVGIGTGAFYFDPDLNGAMLHDTVKVIDGVAYQFLPDGQAMVINTVAAPGLTATTATGTATATGATTATGAATAATSR